MTKTWQVTLKNHQVVLTVGVEEAIYDAALKADIQLPVGCKYGGCITCAAKLLSGKVRQPNATALNRRQSDSGYILLCVARPVSNCIIEEGVEAHEELYQNPFLKAHKKR